MNGPPAKPINGTSSSPTSSFTVSRTYGMSASGSNGRSRSRSAADVNGSATTGPGARSISSPMAVSGTTMSEKRMAASTPSRRTGCIVTSAASSGVRMTSNIPCFSRMARYSGSDRPAWRMNHTGVRATGLPQQASRKVDEVVGEDIPPRPYRQPFWYFRAARGAKRTTNSPIHRTARIV